MMGLSVETMTVMRGMTGSATRTVVTTTTGGRATGNNLAQAPTSPWTAARR